MATHLIPDEMLADYACGAMSPGMSLLVASHLTHAPQSRIKMRQYERIGGVLLEEEPAIEMAPSALDAVFAKIDAAPELEAHGPEPTGPLPLPVLDAVGCGFDEIQWKFRLPGVSNYELDGFGDETVTLLRAKPGAKVPQHTHEGTEATLVLQGILMDDGVAYGTGDVALNDEDDDHRPYISGTETCYCLIVQHGDLRFTGTFSRFLNYLGE